MSNFKSKEEYQNFISAWKSAVNAEEAKSKILVCDHTEYTWNGLSDEQQARLLERGAKIGKYSFTIPDGGHYKERGWINAEHHIFYNMMLGKDPKRGFSPKLKRKLQYGETPWVAFEQAAYRLERAVKNAKYNIDCIGQGKKPPRHSEDDVIKFLKPFSGKLKEADLLKINQEELANARKFHR